MACKILSRRAKRRVKETRENGKTFRENVYRTLTFVKRAINICINARRNLNMKFYREFMRKHLK